MSQGRTDCVPALRCGQNFTFSTVLWELCSLACSGVPVTLRAVPVQQRTGACSRLLSPVVVDAAQPSAEQGGFEGTGIGGLDSARQPHVLLHTCRHMTWLRCWWLL
jgi:hypothetical protein